MLQKLRNCFSKQSSGRIIFFAAVIAIMAVTLVIALDSRLSLRHYEIDTQKINTPVRIALVTDLHSCYYGENQQDLIHAIEEQAPDLLLLVGDIFDDEVPDTNTECFLAGITGKYPCYYVTGNHECWSGTDNFHNKMSILEKYGVTILSDSCEKITVNGTTINICGVDDPDSFMVEFDPEHDPQGYENAHIQKIDNFKQQLKTLKAQAQKDTYTILLSHRPEHFEDYADNQFDLVLCGHAHGGQWRIPGLLNGLYAPDQGLFPSYAGGKYEQDSTTMIVSRGLARESTPVPRIFNPPELVVITLR